MNAGMHGKAEGVTFRAERWVWVSLPWATFALGIKDGKVTDAPPIARKAIGRDERVVAAYYRHQGAKFRPL